MCVVHSRFSEIRRYYQGNDSINAIPLEHAHPNMDSKGKIVLFHNGFISNFDELNNDLKDQELLCGNDWKTLTDSQLITSMVASKMANEFLTLKDALKQVI